MFSSTNIQRLYKIYLNQLQTGISSKGNSHLTMKQSDAKRHGPFLGATSLFRHRMERPRREIKERKEKQQKQ